MPAGKSLLEFWRLLRGHKCQSPKRVCGNCCFVVVLAVFAGLLVGAILTMEIGLAPVNRK